MLMREKEQLMKIRRIKRNAVMDDIKAGKRKQTKEEMIRLQMLSDESNVKTK